MLVLRKNPLARSIVASATPGRASLRPSSAPVMLIVSGDAKPELSVFAHMTDVELEAVYLYLQQLEARPFGGR